MPPLAFDAAERRIEGRIGLCLTPRLRQRQWNVRCHPFQIDLGSRAALPVERMAKAAFQHVEVAFEKDCARRRPDLWLEVRIEEAHRDRRDEIGPGEKQTTAVVLSATLREGSGERIWWTKFRSKAVSEAAGVSRILPPLPGEIARADAAVGDESLAGELDARARHEHAAHPFGLALVGGLRLLFHALPESNEVRQAARSTVPSGSGAPLP